MLLTGSQQDHDTVDEVVKSLLQRFESVKQDNLKVGDPLLEGLTAVGETLTLDSSGYGKLNLNDGRDNHEVNLFDQNLFDSTHSSSMTGYQTVAAPPFAKVSLMVL